MAKGDDAVLKKKNRTKRKNMRGNEPVSARIASIIASKRRRKAGKRRVCEGMCFSLPTPEDPFNDRNDPKAKKNKASFLKKEKDKQQLKEFTTQKKGITELFSNPPHEGMEQQKRKASCDGGSNDCPSKFLGLCLNAIQSAWAEQGLSDDCINEPLLANKWGFDFWKSYYGESDILDESGDCASREQLAWVVSIVSDTIVRKEKEGSIIASPYLLFLVHSQEEAAKVRSVCKPLKELGVHTVSLHPGAALVHQVHGIKLFFSCMLADASWIFPCSLKSCEPEFVVSTPERLLELVLLKAIDISRVSFLVLDGLKSFVSSGFEGKIKSIRGYISGTPQTIIFGGSCGKAYKGLVQSLIREPVCRLSLRESIDS